MQHLEIGTHKAQTGNICGAARHTTKWRTETRHPPVCRLRQTWRLSVEVTQRANLGFNCGFGGWLFLNLDRRVTADAPQDGRSATARRALASKTVDCALTSLPPPVTDRVLNETIVDHAPFLRKKVVTDVLS